ncbi:hypothetical protein ACIGO6_40170 [Streptomyces sp. NPDC053750]|uniref:hypothetical protein n=1 Tax=Streptomyces sp. NPDC053750 TaxID=3365714 RepID=UPI0037CD02D3
MSTSTVAGLDRIAELASTHRLAPAWVVPEGTTPEVITATTRVLAEMKRIDLWLCEYLARHGWATEHTFYSKRTFLREAIALRPDLVAP